MYTIINTFKGNYKFLSNFWPCLVEFEEIIYPSVEHAYQAAKTKNITIRQCITKLTAGEAKKLGRKLELREDWEDVKLDVMLTVLKEKFSPTNYLLIEKLLDTKDSVLIESNYWHDNFWGNCTCPNCQNIDGQNHLGKLLMQVRKELTCE